MPLLGGHGIDDGLGLGELLFGNGAAGLGQLLPDAAQAGDQLENAVDAAELLDAAQLLAEVLEVEGGLLHLAGQLLGLLLLDGLLGLLHEGQDVSHAEDAAGDAVGMEDLELRELLAHADELDGSAGDGLDRKGRAASGVAVHLGEHYARDAELGVEGLGHVDRVLSRHGVGNEEYFLGMHGRLDVGQLLHEHFVHVQAACGVEDDDRGVFLPGPLHGLLRDLHGVHVHRGGEEGHGELLGEHDKLVDGGRPVDVGRHQVGAHLLAAQVVGYLGRRGGLARALQASHHDHRRLAALQVEGAGLAAQQLDQLLVDDADDLLGRRDALGDFAAEALLAHRLDEVADDLEVDVGLQQRQPDLAQAGLDVLFVERLGAAEGLEDAGEPVRETFEHVASLARRGESAAVGGRSGWRAAFRPCLASLEPACRQPGAGLQAA